LTSTPAHGAGRVDGASGRPLRALSATPALIILLLAGLALRLAIAYVFFPDSGFKTDLSTYTSWALTLADHGASAFYASAGFSDYPPAYLYILWPIGLVAKLVAPGDPASVAQTLIKLPPIFVDLVVGTLLYFLVAGWARPGRRAEALGLAAAALYVFNPVTWYDSALWGQTDAIGALVLLAGVAALIRGNSEGAAGLAVLAALVKPQYGVVLVPLVGVVLLKRHLLSNGPRNTAWGPGRLRAWLSREQGPVRILTSALVGVAVFFVVALPFAMGPLEYLVLVAKTANGYMDLTVNAYNPWALIGSAGTPPLAASGLWSDDRVGLLGPLPGVLVGSSLLLVGLVVGLLRGAWRDDRRSLIVVAVFLSAAFFILPTRVHERYLFPVFAFLPILAVGNRRWAVALVLFALGSFMNLHAILTIPSYATDNLKGLPFGDLFRGYPFVVLSVGLQTAGFLFAALQLRAAVARRADPIDSAAHDVDAERVRRREMEPGWSVSGAGGAGASAAGFGAFAEPAHQATVIAGRSVRLEDGPDELEDYGWIRGPGPWAWVKDRLTPPPLRRDRSAELTAEPYGRWDRLDLLIVTLIVIGSFTLRAWHVAQPYDMYFDEVYHARTATEFLQDWRYGMPHSIYEYTHPHLAKYAMAVSIDAFAGNRVSGTSQLTTDTEDATIETRWSPNTAPSERDGDRLYVATGSDVAVFDLATREPVTVLPVAATAVAVDQSAHVLFIAQADGTISTVQTDDLDALRRDPGAEPPAASPFATVPSDTAQITRLAVADGTLITISDDDTLRAFDGGTGDLTGQATVTDAAAAIRLAPTNQVLANPSAVTDVAAEARIVADDVGGRANTIEGLLRGKGKRISLAGYFTDAERTRLQGHIDDGSLPGISVASSATVAVAGRAGVTFLDAVSLTKLTSVDLDYPATGLTLVDRGLDKPTVYAAAGPALETISMGDHGPSQAIVVPMPGTVRDVVWNDSANLVHALGAAPTTGDSTIYVVEPHGNAVYADAALPFDPVRLAVDTQPQRPGDDRMQILAFSRDGQLATVDIGGNAFAWRLPGVIMGAVTAACLYLLARLLFRRRTIGLVTAVLVLAGGMFFANARIAMNDTYVTGFTVAAVMLFAPIYLGIWRRRWQVAGALALIGILLGLALASKWVAAYAIGGLGLLVLLRSALGRIIALLAMILLTGTLGALAIRPADVADPHRNWLFLGLMVVLSVMLAVAMVRRPVRMSTDELRFAVLAPAVLGVLLVAAALLFGSRLGTGLVSVNNLALAGAGSLVVGAAVYGISRVAARFGLGPLAPVREILPGDPVPSPAPSGWLRPGRMAGIPWLYALGCLGAVPIIVYVISYIPWINLGNQWPWGGPAGHTGQNLWDLTVSMYDYHNNLRVPHAASSPWWAWPFDFKPVWFYQAGFANNTTGAIYDSGNLITFWLAIPAIAWVTWIAWRRRSLPLTIVVLLFFAMWLPWTRIDRATFQYHVFSSLPFAVIALAYLIAELWHGPPPGAWLLARLAAAGAVLGPPLLWVFRQPLCALAGTNIVHPDGIACGPITRSTSVSEAAFVSVLVLLVGFAALAWVLWLTSRRPGPIAVIRLPNGDSAMVSPSGALLATLAATLVAIAVVVNLVSSSTAFQLTVHPEELAIGGLVLLSIPAWLVLGARDSRRMALGILIAVVIWFVAWYPNLTGLPMPNSIANIYQGLLPTWNYDFQFAVNTDPPVGGSFVDISDVVILGATTLVVIAVMLAARAWRTRPRQDQDGTIPEAL
jgi:dolichyl-phosphate-mannose--protein O-mannosyl transferase